MKTKNLRLALLVSVMFFALAARAQTVEFAYDDAGNRTSREVIYLQNLNATDSSSFVEAAEHSEMLAGSKITISPNPNGGRFSVKIEGVRPDSQPQIYLHSLKGTLIYENPKAGSLNRIDISQHPKGAYILSLIVGGTKRTWKIIKQ